MTETWLTWAIKAPGPPEKAGYGSVPVRRLDQILYIVPHSAEGWEAFLKLGHRPGEPASWTLSNCIDGDFYQHYPLEALTYTSGGLTQNRDGLACENEGKKGTPINAKQVANLRRLRTDVAALCPNLRAPLLGQGWREHGELTNGFTSCPSGRIQPLYDSYKEVDLETKDIDARLTALVNDARAIKDRFIRADGQDEVYEIVSGRRVWLISPEVAFARGVLPNLSNVKVINAIQLLAWPEGQL